MTPLQLQRAVQHEPYLARMFEILRASPRPVMVEAGACDGYHTKIFNAAVAGIEQHCFEPDPRNSVVISMDKELSSLINVDGPVHLLTAALGNVTGRVPFHLATREPNGACGASSLSALTPALTEAHPWLREERVIEVQSYRFDDFIELRGLPHVDLMWLDVQGSERLVFEGIGWRARRVRWIFTEYDAGYADSRSLPELLAQLNALPGQSSPEPWRVAMEVPGNALLANTGAL